MTPAPDSGQIGCSTDSAAPTDPSTNYTEAEMNSTVLNAIFMFCLKCATFSAIFWTMWLNVIQPMATKPQSNASTAQNAQSAQQAEAYEKQMDRAIRQLDIAEDQQRRMDQYLTIQQENAGRFDAVLKVWERQAGLAK